MNIKLPAISPKLDDIRKTAKFLYTQGYRKDAIELMRISRGEVKIQADCELFDLSAGDMLEAKKCTLLQRKIVAANEVLAGKFGNSEDDYSGAIDKIARGNPRWPKGSKKNTLIDDVATKHGLTNSSLSRFMKTKGWQYENQTMGPEFQYPDWHPDNSDKLFKG